MSVHKSVSLLIIVLVIGGAILWGVDGFRALIVPRNPFSLDNNPSRIIIPQQLTLDTSNRVFKGVEPMQSNASVGFDVSDTCLLAPLYARVRLDGEIKLHNGYDMSHSIIIGPKTYTLRPGSIGILANDPGTWKIYCDGKDSGAVVQIGV